MNRPNPDKPSSINAAQAEARLRAVRNAVLALHKVLIDTERGRYEQSRGKIESSHHALQLLMQDPFFAWLRPMAQLIVHLDEWMFDDKLRNPDDLTMLLDQVRRLLNGQVAGDVFHSEYRRALQDSPEVVVAAGRVAALLNG
ncbi:MAG TPA: hypothetical protein VFO19_05900 [Vicinamibacterales bacterium]|nr:hypothetical protein [Vicinamibacterales bacterium]